jgi:LytS/YehU family sensor histidine kinase
VLDVPVFKGKDLAHFRYRFAGTNEWTTQSINQRTLDFNKLAPGNYILEIACSNESGFFGIPIRFAFEVERPYWQKWWFYVLISLISMLLAGALAISRIRYIRKREELKRNALHAQLKALKAQMNPHFMYNALNSIQALIIQKDVMNSNLYLSKFSNLMRKILDASEREFISVSEEIGILELYLDLEKLRFGNEFVYTVIVDPSVDPYAMEIPSVLLQPYVENALKHGLLHKKGEKKLEIQFREEEGVLYCVIRDNGVGRKRSSEIHQRRSDHRSFATEAINKQVELMNDQSGRAIKVEIVDLEDVNGPTGTEVRVWIPQQDFGK